MIGDVEASERIKDGVGASSEHAGEERRPTGHRRDAVHHLKELKDVGSDDERRAEENVQKLTDEHTKTIDDLLRHKEAEIMEV